MSSPILLNPSDYPKAFETMNQLRTHLDEATFLSRVQEEVRQGYHLVGILFEGKYIALAGYRYSLNLAWGKFLYCDDLVVHSDHKGQGYGDQLMDYLYQEAKKNDCSSFHLDSGVQRHIAHRLYLKHLMDITCHHFGRECQ